MRTIILNESQFIRLLEVEGGPTFNNGDMKEFHGSENGIDAPVHDEQGNLEYAESPDTDVIAGEITPQNWFFSNHRGSRVV